MCASIGRWRFFVYVHQCVTVFIPVAVDKHFRRFAESQEPLRWNYNGDCSLGGLQPDAICAKTFLSERKEKKRKERSRPARPWPSSTTPNSFTLQHPRGSVIHFHFIFCFETLKDGLHVITASCSGLITLNSTFGSCRVVSTAAKRSVSLQLCSPSDAGWRAGCARRVLSELLCEKQRPAAVVNHTDERFDRGAKTSKLHKQKQWAERCSEQGGGSSVCQHRHITNTHLIHC